MEQVITTKSGHKLYIHDTPGTYGTIIAAHGLTGNYKQLHYFQEYLSGTYRFISYDIRGRGNSELGEQNSSIYTHADDLIELIEALNIKNPILMGYSMGGYICAIAASRLPSVAGLILLDGAGEADETTRNLVVPSLERLKKTYDSPEEYIEETKNLYQNLNIEWDSTLKEIARYEIMQEGQYWTHKSNYTLINQDFESFYSFSPSNVCSLISCRTLLIIATGVMKNNQSLFKEQSYANTKRYIKNIQTKVVPVNHYELVFNQQPNIVKYIENFLNEEVNDHAK